MKSSLPFDLGNWPDAEDLLGICKKQNPIFTYLQVPYIWKTCSNGCHKDYGIGGLDLMSCHFGINSRNSTLLSMVFHRFAQLQLDCSDKLLIKEAHCDVHLPFN